MAQYILKRLLLMVPTFLLITVVVFVLINMAPGRPGVSANSQGSEAADQSANQREGYRKFKEQYYLDKPIILNFRFLLDRQDVEEQLETIARNMSGSVAGETEALAVGETAARVLTDAINVEYVALQQRLATEELDDATRDELRRQMQNVGFQQVDAIRPERPAQGDIRDAEEYVENWGNDIVPFLMEIANHYAYVVPVDAEDPWFDGYGVSAEEHGFDALREHEVTVDGTAVYVHPALTRKVRFLAVQRLSQNGQRRVLIDDGETGNEAQQRLNAEIVAENTQLRSWTYGINAPQAEIDETLAHWNEWYGETEDRFALTTGRTLHMLFLETRFARYWSNLASFDLGTSIRYRRPVVEVIANHWQYSIFLSVASLLLAYFISVPLGILAAVKQNQFADRGVGIVLFVLYSLPSFFAASLLQTYVTHASEVEWMQWFPVSGFRGLGPMEGTTWQLTKDVIWHLVLPVTCLTYSALAVLSRYARTGLLDVIRSDYIRTARAKGLSEWIVILKHAVRNGMIPILTLLGTTLPILIGGSIIIEYIFVIDGMGKLMITAIQFRDYNIIMGILLLTAVLTLFGILLSDISYALVDPRISFE